MQLDMLEINIFMVVQKVPLHWVPSNAVIRCTMPLTTIYTNTFLLTNVKSYYVISKIGTQIFMESIYKFAIVYNKFIQDNICLYTTLGVKYSPRH